MHHTCPGECTFVDFNYGDKLVCGNQGRELLLGFFRQFELLFSEAKRMTQKITEKINLLTWDILGLSIWVYQ